MFTLIKLRSQICVGISTATVNTKQGKQNAAMWLMKLNFSQNITFIFIMLIFPRAKLYTKQVSSIVAGYITVYLQKIEVEKIKIKVLICTILEHLPLLYPSNISLFLLSQTLVSLLSYGNGQPTFLKAISS